MIFMRGGGKRKTECQSVPGPLEQKEAVDEKDDADEEDGARTGGHSAGLPAQSSHHLQATVLSHSWDKLTFDSLYIENLNF